MNKIYSYLNEVYKKQQKTKRLFEIEQKSVNSYEKRYDDLQKFRDAMSMFADVRGNTLMPKISVLDNGHVLDHHVLGYLSPIEFMRIGFGNVKRTPIEQMLLLNKQLEEKGIRFIYVALPCKLAVYPEIVNDVIGELIPEDGLIIPQWRKMIQELNNEGVEVVDCYNAFISNKSPNCLFSKNHHISPFGAWITACEISRYINQTTAVPSTMLEDAYSCVKASVQDYVLKVSGDYSSEKLGKETFEVSCVLIRENKKKEIDISAKESEICMIGNCNLQSYLGLGCDITSYLSYLLKYPVIYGGRYLPFAKIDSIDKIPQGMLKGKKILIYVGFVSACFVRAYNDGSTNMIQDSAF